MPAMATLGFFNGFLYCSLFYKIDDTQVTENVHENGLFIANILGLAFLLASD